MALPLKSGADLYNQQLIRAAIWNHGADPSEVVAGLMYFNTSGSNVGKKLRFHTGTDWKTIAFAEDLDVATNKDFVALKTKVEAFLEGDVDSDGVLENLKEIQKFLDNYSSATDLTDILNTKLDKTGGEIKNGSKSNPFNIDTDATDSLYMSLKSGGVGKAYFVWNIGQGVYLQDSAVNRLGLRPEGTPFYYTNGVHYSLIHEGNVGDYAIPKINGTPQVILSGYPLIEYYAGTNFYGRIGFSKQGVAAIHDTSNWQTIIHSGNIGSQIVEGITTHTDNARNASGDITELNSYYSAKGFRISRFNGLNGLGTKNADGLIINWPLDNSYGQQWYMDDESHTIQTRYVAGGSWSDWKTIAFTEFTNSQELQWQDASGNAQNVLFLDGYNDLVLGKETSMAGYRTRIQGNSVELRYGTAQSTGIILNSSGNVTIGSSDSAGTDYKLYINGAAIAKSIKLNQICIESDSLGKYDSSRSGEINRYSGDLHLQFDSAYNLTMCYGGGNVLIGTTTDSGEKLQVNGGIRSLTGSSYLYGYATSTATNISELDDATAIGAGKGFWNIYMWSLGNGKGCIQSGHSNGTTVYDLLLQPFGGNVGIGLTPSAQLHVANDIVANGTIACKGVAAEGSAGMGTADVVAYEMNGNGSQRTWTFSPNLNGTDYIVQIYEYVSGSWEMVLTDVDVTGANVTITFGSAPVSGVKHKAVIIG